jgi:hypothetical protein
MDIVQVWAGFVLEAHRRFRHWLIPDHPRNRLTWPQVMLRDRGDDPIGLDYQNRYPFKSFLIGPDGMLIARDLTGDAVKKAVAEVLGRK